MKRLAFALAFVCALLAAALVAVMMNEFRIEKENAELIKKLEEAKLTVSIDVRGRYIFAEASNGSATVEISRPISDWGLYRKLEIE